MPEAMATADRKRIGEALVEAGLIDELQLRSALADQKRWGNRLGKTLVKLGFVAERPLMRHLSRLMGLPLAEIEGREIDPEVVALLPRHVAEKHRCIPLFVDEDGGARFLYVAMEEPADRDTLETLALRAGMEICPALMGFQALDDALRRQYRTGAGGEADGGFEIGGGGEPVGPDCLRHGEESLCEGATHPGSRATAPGAPDAPLDAPSKAEVSTRRLLQALTQTLIDAGVIDRSAFLEHVRRLAERDDG